MSTRKDIRSLSKEEIITALQAMGEPAFRGRQIWLWLWKKSARSFAEMTDLSNALRAKLEETFELKPASIHQTQISNDGTVKCSFRLWDDSFVEGVLIPTDSRTTACVSSQVGCSLDCKFCATGYLKRQRNLDAQEIYDQVVLLNELSMKQYGRPLDNIVYMGMGEPLLNYANMWRSVELITSEEGLHMSPQRLTISTAGISKMIMKLADDGARFNLALSLHAANDESRSSIMPINVSNPLDSLAEALGYWYRKTRTRPTLEYTVIENVNDGDKEARDLILFARRFPCKINLIEYNPIRQADYKPTGEDRLKSFADALSAAKLIVNVRRSRGKDIDAACGQLVNSGQD
ncbi:MAG: 23S rRNA (adenine(2503)-C(2))-methyltransferase RlmN [Bacteroidetes bacterium]|nr:23S rRNA (adenine(2503)-C(2))-methyltransferase RlmN [Bacteroidota bacterium]